MTDKNLENLLQALESLNFTETRPLIYRLYHDDAGYPLFYSMEDLPGRYIDIDQATYHLNSSHVRVVDGKIVKLKFGGAHKIRPSNDGTPCDPRDVCVVVSKAREHIKWKLKSEN